MSKKASVILAAALAAAVAFSPGCKKGGGNSSQAARGGRSTDRSRIQFPVEAAPVEVRPIVYSVTAVGAVEAFEKVQITARVSGVVDRVLFAEGRPTGTDQVLVEIEPQRYTLAVEAAQATYEKALASKADAEAGLKRRESAQAQNPGLIPGEEIETWKTKVLVAASDVAQTLAALNQAKLNLHDAYVRAPFAGTIETRTVQTGQYVQVGTVLATIVRRDPLLLRFQVAERDAAHFHPGMIAQFRIRDDATAYEAGIVHVAGAADESTRMIAITAEVRNAGPGLRPGSFAEVTVPVSSPKDSPVVPQTAVRPSERGFIAFVIEKGQAVERVLSVGMRTADGYLEILSGLKPGEQLVIRGAEALRTGAQVKIVAGGTPSSPSPAGAGEKR